MDFEKIRDEITEKMAHAIRRVKVAHGSDESVYTLDDLGWKKTEHVYSGYDHGATDGEIRHAIEAVAQHSNGQSWKEKAASRFIEKMLSRGYYGYAKLLKMLDSPLESPSFRWWNWRYWKEIVALINPGGKVTLHEGLFTIGTTLDVTGKYGVLLEGASQSYRYGLNHAQAAGTKLYLDDSVDDHLFKMVESVSNTMCDLTLRNLTFDGNKANNAGNIEAIYLKYTGRVYLDHIVIVNANRYNLYVLGQARGIFIDTLLTYGAGAASIYLDGVQGELSKIWSIDNDDMGIAITSGTGLTTEDVHLNMINSVCNAASGLYLLGGAGGLYNITVSDSEFGENGNDGISIIGSTGTISNITIANTVCFLNSSATYGGTANTRDGIRVDGGAGAGVSKISIHGCHCRGAASQKYGINLVNATNITGLSIIGGGLNTNATGPFAKDGAAVDLLIRHVTDYKTQNSGTATMTAGTTTVTQAHGLAGTPNGKIPLTPNWNAGYMWAAAGPANLDIYCTNAPDADSIVYWEAEYKP